MTARFGVAKEFHFSGYDYQDPPAGAMYIGFFQEGNFNYKEGNKEAIWNISRILLSKVATILM
jgi:hypothetical protein